MSDKSEGDSSYESDSSSSDSSDEETKLSEPFERDFFKTLSCLKSKDPIIYDSGVKFFKDVDCDEEGKEVLQKKKKEKPMFLKDFERTIITERGGRYSDDEEDLKKEKPFVEVQKDIQENLKRAVLEEEEDEEDDSFGGLLTKRVKTKKEAEKEEADYIQWLKGQKNELKEEDKDLKPLHEYWNDPNLDEKEGFLKDFILNKRFLDEESNDIDDKSELSEDGRVLEAQEAFEQEYNFRFENNEDLVKRYPREVDGSLRRKDDKRTKKRAEIRERKKIEKEKKKQEIKKNQKQKKKEIEEKLEELKKLIGNDELGFSKEDILEEFDSEKFDKRMEQVFNDNFYAGEDLSKPDCLDEGEEWEGENVENADDNDFPTFEDPEFNMDCEAPNEPSTSNRKKKETRAKRKKNRKKSAFSEISQIDKPIYDPKVHDSFQKYMDEFYSLDCEDFIDDLPCRFKYRTVEPNNYGLSVEEILMADDKELNKWSSVKKILKKRPEHIEKNEVKVYRQKAKDENLKRKILPSLFKDEEMEENNMNNEDQIEDNNFQCPEDNKMVEGENIPETQNRGVGKKKKKESKQKENPLDQKIQMIGKGVIKQKNKKQQYFGKFKKSFGNNKPEFSDNRLRAYGIKPKRFRKKDNR